MRRQTYRKALSDTARAALHAEHGAARAARAAAASAPVVVTAPAPMVVRPSLFGQATSPHVAKPVKAGT
jgi:hypothetical protein